MDYYFLDPARQWTGASRPVTDARDPVPPNVIATADAPPALNPGEAARWSNGAWVVVTYTAPDAPVPPPLFITPARLLTLFTNEELGEWKDELRKARANPDSNANNMRFARMIRVEETLEKLDGLRINDPRWTALVTEIYEVGALGPVWDGIGTPTQPEQDAIDRRDAVLAGEVVSP